ncbi:membrane protein [Streptomyces noursei ZPM]|uniref:Membrane protein n=1 Tax=Streptomyces noursei TaxID=1971 RepID=A0A059W0P1_STRNR|nr:hypothetical protein DC74_2323 [Streptomyces noursei]AKA03240.1 membrane protein [Streptomyces noursei ZPM]EOT02623.1 hypothetical protein K530_17806 [Streptomyces noursei CCRC 11814]EXU88921.1 hypothetical protein P354_26120 [Streptomyces noursei PD-1]GCB90472.1 membrane protein [Streptomyces noursei]
MITAPNADPGQHDPPDYRQVQSSPEFAELRSAHRSFAFPLTLAFILWYLGYVLLSSYAGAFMATKVAGHLNVAFVLGIAQFATTFLIAWWYSRHAAARLDPRAEAIKARLEGTAATPPAPVRAAGAPKDGPEQTGVQEAGA